MQGYTPVAPNYYNTDNTAGYIYLALALIMSMMFSFTGVMAIGLLCTIPAAICAKQVLIYNTSVITTITDISLGYFSWRRWTT